MITKEYSSWLISAGNELFDGLEQLTELRRDRDVLTAIEFRTWSAMANLQDPLEELDAKSTECSFENRSTHVIFVPPLPVSHVSLAGSITHPAGHAP